MISLVQECLLIKSLVCEIVSDLVAAVGLMVFGTRGGVGLLVHVCGVDGHQLLGLLGAGDCGPGWRLT